MLRTRAMSIAAAVITMFVLAAQASAQEVLMRMKFREGEVQKTKTESKTAVSMGEMKFNQDMTIYVTLKIKKVEGDVATIESKCTRITGKALNPMTGEDMTFDSEKDDPSSNPMFAGAAGMIGKVVTVKMNALGKVLENKDAAAEGASPGSDEMQKMMEMAATVFPEAPVKADFEWKQENVIDIPKLGALKTKIKTVIGEIQGDLVKGRFEGSMEVEAKKAEEGKPAEEGGEEAMTPKIKEGKLTGTFEFDHARGLYVRRVTKIEMTMNQMGMDMPVSVEQTFELVKVGGEEEETKETPGK